MKINKLVIVGLLLTGCMPVVNPPTQEVPKSPLASSSIASSSSPKESDKPISSPTLDCTNINTKQSGAPENAPSPTSSPDDNSSVNSTNSPSSSPSSCLTPDYFSKEYEYSKPRDVSPTKILNISNDEISLVFDDEFWLRIDKTNPLYVKSLVGKDISGINNIIKEYELKISSPYSEDTEEDLLENQKKMIIFLCRWYPNSGSFFTLKVTKPTNALELVTKLRALPYVKVANYSAPGSN